MQGTRDEKDLGTRRSEVLSFSKPCVASRDACIINLNAPFLYSLTREEIRLNDAASNPEIAIRDGLDAMDFAKVTQMLASSYWCPGIGIDEVVKGARNSALVAGAFLPSGEQIGYARAISDKTRFAYFLDVFVDEPYRKKGLGRRMVAHIMAHETLADVYQWLLITKDAHKVYEKLDFKPVSRPLDWMEVRRPRPR